MTEYKEFMLLPMLFRMHWERMEVFIVMLADRVLYSVKRRGVTDIFICAMRMLSHQGKSDCKRIKMAESLDIVDFCAYNKIIGYNL